MFEEQISIGDLVARAKNRYKVGGICGRIGKDDRIKN